MASSAIILFLSHNSSMYISAHLFVPVMLFTDMFCYFLYKRYYSYHFSTSYSPIYYKVDIHSHRRPCPAFILYLHFHPFSRATPLFAHKNTTKTFISTVLLSHYINYSSALSFSMSNSPLSHSQLTIKFLF